MDEDGVNRFWILDKRDDTHDATAVRTEQRINLEDLLQKASPIAAGGLPASRIVRERDQS